ncbi:MAG: TonB-dependent receptor [Cyclobacteriaceae bacterium]|nr:TonB-dependent receptor [Cyclobacteriaceae bacterium]
MKKLLHQLYVMTKYAVLGLFLQAMLAGALLSHDGNAQGSLNLRDVKVNVNFNDVQITRALEDIERQTGFSFNYNVSDLTGLNVISGRYRNQSLYSVLIDLSKQANIHFRQVNNYITVKRIVNETNRIETDQEGQVITVTGKVSSREDPSGLPGANVIVEGTSTGTVTDISGNYNIEVTTGATLVFSSVGYISEKIVVGNQSVINVVMIPDITALDEIVVVGYGALSKRDITGAVTSVKSEQLTKVQSPSVDAMLQGQGAGIQVNQATGVPGGPVRVMIRGTSSVSSGTEPLWVIDGIPINVNVGGEGGSRQGSIPQNPLASINPNDIESIEVLKDAAATAIYGSRGSNGVVLVTTKTGKTGVGGISIDYQTGVSHLTRTPSDMGFANSSQWLGLVNQSRANVGLTSNIEDNLGALTVVNVGPNTLKAGDIANTNWFDEIFRSQGSFQEANLSTNKAFEKGNAFFSVNYRKDEGILKNNDFERVSFRANIEYEPVNNLRTGVRLTGAYTNNQRVMNGGAPSGNDAVASGGFREATAGALPIYPIFAPGEDQILFNPTSGMNLRATTDRALFRDQFEQYRMLGGVFADYNIAAVKGLSVRTELSADITSGNSIFWTAADLRPRGINFAAQNFSNTRNLNYNLFATYNREFGTDHSINFVFGTESQRFSGIGGNLFGEGIPGRNQEFGSPTAPIDRAPSAGFGGERYIRAYFSRANYKFKDRYLLGASFRRDGVSIFTPENRWSNFAALSAGWIISEEEFFRPLDFINFLKIRGSFGQTGNQNVPTDVTFIGTIDWPRYGNAAGSQVLRDVAVTDLTWETTNAYDLGIDFEMFESRISGSVGYYRQDVIDLLFLVPIPPSVGLLFGGNSIWGNIADMRNDGFEFNINTVNVSKGNFRWSTNFNFTTNRNQLVSINEELDSRGQGVVSGLTRNISGKPLSTFFVAEYAGIDPQSGLPYIYEIDRNLFNATGQTVKTGNVIPASSANIQNHRILQDKTGLPTFFGGLTNTFNYKGFELTALLTFQGGNWIYDNPLVARTQVGLGNGNLYTDLIDNVWTQPGDVTRFPRLMWNNRFHLNNEGLPQYNADGSFNYNQNYSVGGANQAMDRYLFKGDFMRLRTVQLAYNLQQPLLNRLGLKGMRVFVSGNNLLTFTAYPGWDPEILTFGGGAQARNLQQGSATEFVPQMRTWLGGVSITF